MSHTPDINSIAGEIRKRAEELFGCQSLSCQCAIISTALHMAFEQAGLKSRLACGLFTDFGDEQCEHCWVEVGNQIIDLTATQFGIDKPVLVCSKDDERFERKRYVSKSGMRFRSWPEEQRPKRKFIKVLTGEVK